MSFDLQQLIESKISLRRSLAALPVAEKLRMLDAMRERELAIRRSAALSESSDHSVKSSRHPAPSQNESDESNT